MKFKGIAIPLPTQGVAGGRPKQVVPDQSMSLQEILQRFTRGEAVPIGHEVSHAVTDVDLEKMKYADLVDKAEFSARLEEVKKAYEKAEAQKAEKQKAEAEAKAKADEEKRIRIAAKKLAEQNSAKAK